jgi:hypothetical protein
LQWIGTKPWPAPKKNLSHFNIVERFLNIVRSGKQEIKNENRRERTC